MDEKQIEATLDKIRASLEAGRVQEAIGALIGLHPADRAEAFSDLNDEDQAVILPRLPIREAADLLEDLGASEAADAAGSLPAEQLADVLDEMEPDEAADVLGDLSPEKAAQALSQMEDAEEVIPLLGHPDQSAGGLMTTWFVALRRHTTASQAIDFLRQVEPSVQTPYYLYVVDRGRKLIGVVGLRDLVISSPETIVESFMNPNVISVTTRTDQEVVARQMARHDLAALPVVDDQGVLQGVVTHDDMIDVLEDETTEDVLHLGGIEAGPLVHKPYWTQRIPEVVRSRFLWLLGLFVAETLTGSVLRHFRQELEAVVSLSFFIPLIIGTGGNAGSQTVTAVIRALALQEIRPRDVLRVVLREVGTSALLGLLLGLVAFGRVLLWGVGIELALVVASTIFAVCIWANSVGSLIPLGAVAVRIDPTVMSAPLIATLVDATGLLIYMSIAGLVIQRI